MLRKQLAKMMKSDNATSIYFRLGENDEKWQCYKHILSTRQIWYRYLLFYLLNVWCSRNIFKFIKDLFWFFEIILLIFLKSRCKGYVIWVWTLNLVARNWQPSIHRWFVTESLSKVAITCVVTCLQSLCQSERLQFPVNLWLPLLLGRVYLLKSQYVWLLKL